MKINRIHWLIFGILSIISLFVWVCYSYPQLAFTQFAIDRHKALAIAHQHLEERGADPSSFEVKATVFQIDQKTNRYLQNAIGFEQLTEFIKKHDFDMFIWVVRFFNKNQKEEYRLSISSSTGQVTSLRHFIEDSAARDEITRETAKEEITTFLQNKFNFNPELYSVHGDLLTNYDNRAEYSFSWQKKDVLIPWNEDEDSGFGKLTIGAKISGDEILSFSKNTFYVPDQFEREMDKQQTIGDNISSVMKIIYYILFTATIFFVVVRRNHLAMHRTKYFYINIIIFSFLLSMLASLNQFQAILFNYKSSLPFDSYVLRYFLDTMRNALFINVALLTPALAGELLHREAYKKKKEGSFLYYIQSTFFSRNVAQLIFLGYFICIIMLGMQALLIEVGQKQWGVWTEYTWMTRMSTNYFPFLAAFIIAFKASMFEEILYRMFAMSWFKKLFKHSFWAVLLSSLIWGFAHSDYPVYPMWFRGVEVSCLGLFLAIVYLRFGLIPVIVGHFLFDAFWGTAGYLLGESQPYYFYTSLGILLLPLGFALIAFVRNKEHVLKPLQWQLNKPQQFNLDILKTYLIENKDKDLANVSIDVIKTKFIQHGWDIAVVELAIAEVYQISPEEV